jgi:hypothetical protein
MSAKPILGISFDLSKKRTGICAWADKQPIAIVSVEYTAKYLGALMEEFTETLYYDLDKLIIQTINAIGHNLDDYVNPLIYNLDWIAYEDVRPVNKRHMEQHFGMVAMLHYEAHYLPTHVFPVTTGEAKKALSGKGNATKEEQLAAAQAEYPTLGVSNHDEADALSVGLHVITRVITPG